LLYLPDRSFDAVKTYMRLSAVRSCCWLLAFRGELPTGDDLLVKDDLVKLKRCIYSAQVTNCTA